MLTHSRQHCPQNLTFPTKILYKPTHSLTWGSVRQGTVKGDGVFIAVKDAVHLRPAKEIYRFHPRCFHIHLIKGGESQDVCLFFILDSFRQSQTSGKKPEKKGILQNKKVEKHQIQKSLSNVPCLSVFSIQLLPSGTYFNTHCHFGSQRTEYACRPVYNS